MRAVVVVVAIVIAAHVVEPKVAYAHGPQGGPRPAFVLLPRFTFIEGQYPQGVAASIGLIAGRETPQAITVGVISELELGLSGPTLGLGIERVNAGGSYERVFSLGIQGIVHRTWPGWSLSLPTDTTYVGGEVFVGYFAFRCSAGVMARVGSERGPSLVPTVGCGVGFL